MADAAAVESADVSGRACREAAIDAIGAVRILRVDETVAVIVVTVVANL
jgi:hypothetical protein